MDSSSGDRVWWFDFSEVAQPGDYYVVDVNQDERSCEFTISENIYREVLKHSVRSFFYQRAGFEKKTEFAGEAWADGASNVGPLQDRNCRLYSQKDDPNTEKDFHGGWYDAGDYNKYTHWTANYVMGLLLAYKENPVAFGDDYRIPESGNGIPDVLDEVKWGLDWLLL
ncbi:MAG: glycoside hydrolase family 9 protein [Chitinispirillaceae bacterium]